MSMDIRISSHLKVNTWVYKIVFSFLARTWWSYKLSMRIINLLTELIAFSPMCGTSRNITVWNLLHISM